MNPEDMLHAPEEKRSLAFTQVMFIFVVPVLLLYFNILSKDWRVVVLAISSLLIFGIIKKEQWTSHMLGLQGHSFRRYLLPYLIFIAVGLVSIYLYSEKLEMEVQPLWWTNKHFWFLFALVSFLQEFAYRGFLIPILKRLSHNRLIVVLANAALFTLLHIIYPVPQVMLPLAFIGGLAFATMYMKWPNLILISIAHSVLNFQAVMLGFFVIAPHIIQ